ncbi:MULTISPECIES: phage tail protein I [unclassified Pseudoalteromonas]|uniref:phage tail protein I n=1 Tax=unclassified Pseudoalteromonas TaxID=194690 RepID=UPI001F34DEE9|nr:MULTISPECIES: phage tail protein I [unclassified Pseudoalteromonas]MCF2827068.1 phage tail protein I [Pseudoalteromonas sp. OF5H-5]MCF2832030.1 phage tail protein I [Pseudoalteromonas sp. DL2-H6]MCF2925919.1 phage tail protein I [Pseudoalteromonas sp. DL2-H1]
MSQSKSSSALKALTTYSVLPDNSSHLERGLELSLSRQLYAVDSIYPNLLNAWRTPLNVVPYLAAEKQLPVWDTADSEHVKRNLAGNAWQVRKLSGTRAGLKMALASFEFENEIKPWYQQTPVGEPYSLEIVAWERGNKPVNVENVHKLKAYLKEVQSERDKIELSLMFGVETSMGMAGARAPVTNYSETDCNARLWPMPEAHISVSVAGAITNQINVCPIRVSAKIPVVRTYGQLNMVGYVNGSINYTVINARADL